MEFPKHQISAPDFRSIERTWIRFSSDRSRNSPNKFTDFEWRDYCPKVFRHLQELDNIDSAGYMLSICRNETLRELSSPGKIGCLLYLSHDDRFVVKTIRKPEMKVLLEMLPNYYHHVQKYDNTLLTKFYGLHVGKSFEGCKVRFVVMGNIFQSGPRIHRRFHLKSSSQGRYVSNLGMNESTTFKDLDLDFTFHLNPSTRDRILSQIKIDCNFLEAEGIMDYSLLLAMHLHSPISSTSTGFLNEESSHVRMLKRGTSLPSHSLQNIVGHDCSHDSNPQPSFPTRSDPKLGVRMMARAFQLPRNKSRTEDSDCSSSATEGYNVVLYFGIIDILQEYNMGKRIERAYKSLQFSSKTTSAMNPKTYSTRFQDFICKVFQTEDLHR